MTNREKMRIMRALCKEYPGVNLMQGFLAYQKVMQRKRKTSKEKSKLLNDFQQYCIDNDVLDGSI